MCIVKYKVTLGIYECFQYLPNDKKGGKNQLVATLKKKFGEVLYVQKLLCFFSLLIP